MTILTEGHSRFRTSDGEAAHHFLELSIAKLHQHPTLTFGCILFVSHVRIVNRGKHMTFTVEFEREDDGRWLAEVIELPGVLAYGETSDEAIAKAQALALRTLADRLEHAEGAPEFLNISFAAA
jgi:predicted RNase H-like HicB family nuclease